MDWQLVAMYFTAKTYGFFLQCGRLIQTFLYHYPIKRGWRRFRTCGKKRQMFPHNYVLKLEFLLWKRYIINIQSTLVFSKSKGPSETLRDIRTSTNQISRIEQNTNRTIKFHKWTCTLTPLVRNIYWKYCGKGEKLLLRSNFSSYPQHFVTWC